MLKKEELEMILIEAIHRYEAERPAKSGALFNQDTCLLIYPLTL